VAEAATVARPYARAAFDHARADGSLAAWGTLLAHAAAAVEDERVAPLLGHPKTTPAALAELLLAVAGDGTGEGGRNFVRLLAENRRLALLPEIAGQFETLRAEHEHTADVEVVSAVPLDAAQRARFESAMSKRLARKVRLVTHVDASLLGGAIVRAGDFVIDGSLKGKLERLASTLAN
jgi:F-type H+-transporting ATPase subunit delta